MIHIERHGPVMALRMSRSFLGRPLHWTAGYWIDGLLIDTGPLCTAEGLAQILEQLHLDQVVITHAHAEQTGGLAVIRQRYPDVPIYAPMRSLPLLKDPTQLKLQLYQRLVWGTPNPIDDICGLDDLDNVVKTPGFTFRVLETPGHTKDHVSLFEASRRWLFCGDTFVGGRDDAWMPEVEMFGIVSSLRSFASLRPERMFPGSGNVRRTPLPEIHQKIRQLVKLAQEVGKLESVGLTTPEIVACLFKEEPRITFWTSGHYSTANLVEACRSYNAVFSPIELLDSEANGSDASYPGSHGDNHNDSHDDSHGGSHRSYSQS